MPSDTPLSNIHPSLQNYFGNSVTDIGNIRLTRTLDNTFDSNFSAPTSGEFEAVVLSGIRTEDNTTGTDETDGTLNSNYILVRPLDDSRVSTPNPLDYGDLSGMDQYAYIQSTIRLHAVKYLARFEHEQMDMNKPSFGEIITCFYEAGGTIPDDPRKLRYKSRPFVPNVDDRYRNLMFIAAADTGNTKALFDDGRQLPSKVGDFDLMVDMKLSSWEARPKSERLKRAKAAAAYGLSANIAGKRYKPITRIVIHYTAGASNKTPSEANRSESENTAWGYHYIIGKKGDFIEPCPPEYNIYHAGGHWDDSIGIGIINRGYWKAANGNPDGPPSSFSPGNAGWGKGENAAMHNKIYWFEKYTKEQIDTATSLAAKLCKKFNIDPNNIETHHDASPGTKSDSGPLFLGGNELTDFKNRVRQEMALL